MKYQAKVFDLEDYKDFENFEPWDFLIFAW